MKKIENYLVKGFGANSLHEQEKWLNALTAPMELKEGMIILDYGCGSGRLFNHLNGLLKDFKYVGVDKGTQIAMKNFRNDSRFTFYEFDYPDFNYDYIVFGSVFTHLTYNQIRSIKNEIRLLTYNKLKIIFSIFLGENYEVGEGGMFDIRKCYSKVTYTEKQLKSLFGKVKEYPSYTDVYGNKHHIFKC
jgi:SAM-dependent methyltransferase